MLSALQAARDSQEWVSLSSDDQRAIELELRDAKLAGATLEGDAKVKVAHDFHALYAWSLL